MQNQKTPEEEGRSRRTSNQPLLGSADRVRNTLALVTVVGFVAITATLAIIFPLFALAAAGDEALVDHSAMGIAGYVHEEGEDEKMILSILEAAKPYECTPPPVSKILVLKGT